MAAIRTLPVAVRRFAFVMHNSQNMHHAEDAGQQRVCDIRLKFCISEVMQTVSVGSRPLSSAFDRGI
jgi:hypothetical protein